MARKNYLAIADLAQGETNWSITFPGFPGVTSVAESFSDLARQAADALATAVEDIEAAGETLPPAIEDGDGSVAMAGPGVRIVIATQTG